MAKNDNYNDFSNRTSFNGKACKEGEILVPVVLSEDMKTTLLSLGLKYDNAETWRMPNGHKVPVVFIPCRPEEQAANRLVFNQDVKTYLRCSDIQETDDLSLDQLLEDVYNEDGRGYDPTGTTEDTDTAALMEVFELLIDDLEKQDENMGQIIRLLAAGYPKKEIIERINIGKGKTQSYSFISKTQKMARDIYDEKYR